jgi:hypothetical protein
MKKLTRKEKIQIDEQLKRKNYHQGGHTVCVDAGDPITIIIKGREAYLPTGRRLPVPEEWWV